MHSLGSKNKAEFSLPAKKPTYPNFPDASKSILHYRRPGKPEPGAGARSVSE